jgi:hypothetical protein
MFSPATDDGEQERLQSKINELQVLERSLIKISPDSSHDEFEELRRRIHVTIA